MQNSTATQDISNISKRPNEFQEEKLHNFSKKVKTN